MKNSHFKDFVGVVSIGPILLLVGLALSLGAHFLLPVKIFADPIAQNIILGIGIFMLVVGTGLIFWAQSISSKKVHTEEDPKVEDFMHGPYRYGRHPGTLGLLVMYGGFTLIVNSLVMLIISIGFLSLMTMIFAPWEEEFMVDSVGEPYREYQKRVRMWI